MGGKTSIKVEKELGCCGHFAKGLLYIFNVLFLLSGILLIVMGLWVALSKTSNHIADIIETSLYQAAAYVLFVAGACVLVVAAFGCCGAKFENRCLLLSYFVFLMFIFIFELVAGIIALACYTQAEAFIEDSLTKSLKTEYGDVEGPKQNVTQGWDWVQESFQCCGVSGNASEAIELYKTSDWYKNSTGQPGHQRVPVSCCSMINGKVINQEDCVNPSLSLLELQYINSNGCYTQVRDKVIQYATILAGIGIVVSVIQIFGMIFACCMFRQLI